MTRARDYIRSVYRELMRNQPPGSEYPQGAFLTAALEIMRELESPVKEETLARLAVLELANERSKASGLTAVG